MSNVELSVIIVSFNTRELLRSCLGSVYRAQHHIAAEVVVVDNASTDGSIKMAMQEFPQATLKENPYNLGFARAVNQGLSIARGEYILLLNSDVEILSSALQRAVAFLQAHLHAGIVGCKLLNADGTVQPSCESFPSLRDYVFESFFLDRLFPRSKLFGRFHLTYFHYDHVAEVDRVMGAFLMIRRRTIEEIGMLDEKFFFYGEETDWCYRAKQKGWRVYFLPHAEAIHHGGQSADPISPRMFVQLHEGRFRFYQKYHTAPSVLAARIVLGIGALLRSFLWTGAMLYNVLFAQEKLKFSQKKIAAGLSAFCWYLGIVQSEGQNRARKIAEAHAGNWF